MSAHLNPIVAAGLIELTIPDKPRSSKQRYRLTDSGRKYMKEVHHGDTEYTEKKK